MAAATHGFTPRYLKDLVVEAINHFMARISRQKGRLDGLNERDLIGQSFWTDDWYRALQAVYESYDAKARIEEDERLHKVIRPGGEGKRSDFGFVPTEDPHPLAATLSQFQLVLQSRETR